MTGVIGLAGAARGISHVLPSSRRRVFDISDDRVSVDGVSVTDADFVAMHCSSMCLVLFKVLPSMPRLCRFLKAIRAKCRQYAVVLPQIGDEKSEIVNAIAKLVPVILGDLDESRCVVLRGAGKDCGYYIEVLGRLAPELPPEIEFQVEGAVSGTMRVPTGAEVLDSIGEFMGETAAAVWAQNNITLSTGASICGNEVAREGELYRIDPIADVRSRPLVFGQVFVQRAAGAEETEQLIWSVSISVADVLASDRQDVIEEIWVFLLHPDEGIYLRESEAEDLPKVYSGPIGNMREYLLGLSLGAKAKLRIVVREAFTGCVFAARASFWATASKVHFRLLRRAREKTEGRGEDAQAAEEEEESIVDL